jgi:uncharacterized protein YdhG (YjbR/CyaY superfamily)
MAVNDITATSPVPPATSGGQNNAAGQSAPARPPDGANQARAAAAAVVTQALDPVLQNELLINEILRSLNFVPRTPLETRLINVTPPPLTDPDIVQDLDIVLQKELLINQALQNLSFTARAQTDALLINETPPQVEADERLDDLDAVQQNELLVNEALLTLNAANQEIAAAEAELTARVTAAAPQALAAALREAEQVPAAVAAAEAAALLLALAPGEVATVVPPTPIAATFAAPTPTQFPVPFFLLNPDRTPYVLAVHEIRNPNPAPGEPVPISPEVQPAAPAAMTRPVARATLRQIWARQRLGVYEEKIPSALPALEKDLRRVLNRVNADLTASGQPLHLVVARSERGYAVEVYDCSDNEICRLTYDVPLKPEELTTVLENLQYETGIIIDISS